MRKFFPLICCLYITHCAIAQTGAKTKKAPIQKGIKISNPFSVMPFNRMISSAGKVITFGNPNLENHALDIAVMPGKKSLAVEDRYGIVIVDAVTGNIKNRWAFDDSPAYLNVKSTYSGISAFEWNQKTYLVWGASDTRPNKSYVMIAECAADTVAQVASIKIEAENPATNALPNQVAVTKENGEPYLYAALNGNNKLVKFRFADRQIVWTAPTGVAPFGVAIVGTKAYVTNWAGPLVTDETRESAGTPWGSAYTNPQTGATAEGSLSIIDITTGTLQKELKLGLHPNAIVSSPDRRFLYIANGNSDFISVVDVNREQVIDSIPVGLFSKGYAYFGSSPNGLAVSGNGSTLYVANGLDNAVAVLSLNKYGSAKTPAKPKLAGYIPTEAYPSGIALVNNKMIVANLEATGARVLSQPGMANAYNAYTIHKQLASVSMIALPNNAQLNKYTEKVRALNLAYRLNVTNQPPRPGVAPRPLPERIGEPSVFKHVVYIIKENKTYDQVFGDMKSGNGDNKLCVFGEEITPNQHELARNFSLMDNYYASGKSSAEGHQWTDAAMVSDYVEKNVRAWFRSYPHRQEDALVYNKSGFIWNNALDNGKTVRIYGEACTTVYDEKMNWFDFYAQLQKNEKVQLSNTSTIARIRPILSPGFPDCDNYVFPDQLRANVFIEELKMYETMPGDQLPNLMVVSLPNDHTAGTSPDFPTTRAMVADNDLALGRIIEALSHSRFWDSTVVFVTQDDSQSGWDHVSSYRTTGQVISPYSNLKKTISTNYNQTSMVRTIEQILGIPPMNIIDATALPMFDFFGDTRSDYKFKALPNRVPLNEANKKLSQLKGKALYYAKQSMNEVFNELDGGEDDKMNRIIWFSMKGEEPYPSAR